MPMMMQSSLPNDFLQKVTCNLYALKLKIAFLLTDCYTFHSISFNTFHSIENFSGSLRHVSWLMIFCYFSAHLVQLTDVYLLFSTRSSFSNVLVLCEGDS